ncbi:UbiA family prenyltransferase [bacterium]|nr:UbiA family prenyltransferase [bacterium]
MNQKIGKFFKFIWNEFIYGGHLQCLGFVGIVIIASDLFSLKINWTLLVFVYLIFYLIYIYNRFKEIQIDELTNPERVKHFKGYFSKIKKIFYFLFFFLIGALIYIRNFPFLVFSLSLLFLGLLYTPTLKNFTKKIIGFKNFYVALFFSVIVFSPFFYYFYPLDKRLLPSIFIFAIFVFLKALMMQVFLDCKDVEGDKKINLRTFPVVFGREKTLKFLKLFDSFITGFILIVFCLIYKVFLTSLLILLFLIPFNFICVDLARNRKYFGYILKSAEFFLWLILFFIGKTIL